MQDRCLEDIEDKYHLTRERVQQIKDKALLRLRLNSMACVLKVFWDH
jgi:RNA polymerase primary sigma factor